MSISLYTNLTYIILQPIYLLTLYRVYQYWFIKEPAKHKLALCFSTFFIIDAAIYCLINNSLVFLISSYILFYICTLPYEATFKTNCTIALITLISFTVSEFISYGTFKLISLIIVYKDTTTDMLCTLVITRLIQFLIVPFIPKLFKNRKSYNNSIKYNPIIYAIPLFSIWLMYFCYSIATPFDISSLSDVISLLITLTFIVIINIIAFAVFDKQAKQNMIEQENISLKNLVDMQIKEYSDNVSYNEEIIKIRHDIKNKYIALLNHASAGNTSEIINYIKNELSIIETNKGISHTGIFTIDSIINYKHSVAQKFDIDFKLSHRIDHDTNIDDSDLCIIIGNALDNSIEYLSSHDCTDKVISIDIKSNKTAFAITIENNVNENIIISNNMTIQTTKKEPYHGYGLISVKNITEKYNGNIILDCANNKFTFGAVLFYGNR